MTKSLKMCEGPIDSSFRDPSGFLFQRDGILYRQVNQYYRENYKLLMTIGFYDQLVKAGLMVAFSEVDIVPEISEVAYRVIKPNLVPFVSYPYEWCFSQLKDAALTTLEIQRMAVVAGMSLKDASAYNIQFIANRPTLIDTLSFESYKDGAPWVAYRQFCQHFLAPLALMSYTDIRLSQLMRVYIDGIPLDLTTKLLPLKAKMMPGLFTHIYLQAKFQERYADKQVKVADTGKSRMSRKAFFGLIDNLQSVVKRLKYIPGGTEWSDYYEATNYTEKAKKHKSICVAELVKICSPRVVWDLGANTGQFSKIAAQRDTLVVAFDVDPGAVEKNYLECCEKGRTSILPLIIDLTNPSSGMGWHSKERMSLVERGPADLAMALALIHHLAISNNVPFSKIVEFFREICSMLIIEFVPKSDSQVERLLATREDIFNEYTQEFFEEAFEKSFVIEKKTRIEGTERTIYLMRNKVALS